MIPSAWSDDVLLDDESVREVRRILEQLRPIVHDRRANSATLAEMTLVMAYLPRLCSYLEYLVQEPRS